MTQLLNIKQVAEKYSLSVKTLYKWVSEGTIPHYKINGAVRFSDQTLERWLQRREIKARQ